MHVLGIGGKFTHSGHEWKLVEFTKNVNGWFGICISNQIVNNKSQLRERAFTLREIEDCL